MSHVLPRCLYASSLLPWGARAAEPFTLLLPPPPCRRLITSSRLNTPELMLAEVKRVGLRIQAAKPIGEDCCGIIWATQCGIGQHNVHLAAVSCHLGSVAAPWMFCCGRLLSSCRDAALMLP